jgi:hypothetical protein
MTLEEIKRFDLQTMRLKLNLALCENEIKEAKKFGDHTRLIKAYKEEHKAHTLMDKHWKTLQSGNPLRPASKS